MKGDAEGILTSVWGKLLRSRIVMLGTPIDEKMSAQIIAGLLFLKKEAPQKPASLYVNSPGGSMTAALAILDTMDFVGYPVHTCCIGDCFGAATIIVAHGTRGHRSSVKAARIGLGPLRGGPPKNTEDAKVQAEQLVRIQKRMIEIIAKDTGRMPGFLEHDLSRDQFMSPSEALDYGLIDTIVEKVSS